MKKLEDNLEITMEGIEALDAGLEERPSMAILLVLYEAYLDDIEGHGWLDEGVIKERVIDNKYLEMTEEEFMAEVKRVARRAKQ